MYDESFHRIFLTQIGYIESLVDSEEHKYPYKF